MERDTYHIVDKVDGYNHVKDEEDGRGRIPIICFHHHIWVTGGEDGGLKLTIKDYLNLCQSHTQVFDGDED